MDLPSPTFCAAPWTVHCINADGTVGVCCVNSTALAPSEQHQQFIDGADVVDMKTDMLAGRPAKGCEKCYDHEAAGVYSLRNLYNDLTAGNLDISRLHEPGYANRTWYDLSLSNKCNQRCRICGPYNSTAWHKDAKSLMDLSWVHVNWRQLDEIMTDGTPSVPGILDSMKAATDPFRIELKGGEPLYMDSSRQLLSEMIAAGLHEKTKELRIISNGTQHDDHMLGMLAQFPAIDMALSIDATGRLHEYTRGTSMTWDQCRSMWDKLVRLPNIKKLRISNTIYAYTIFNLGELRDWVAGEFGDIEMADALLHKPRYLHAKIIPSNLRQQAVNMLGPTDEMRHVLLSDPTADEFGHKQSLDDIIHDLRTQFKTFTRRMDALRSESCAEIVPQLADLLV